jgi:hypothetical protein
MTYGRKLRPGLLFLLLAVVMISAVSCRRSPEPPTAEAALAPPGEPETYSATIVHSIEDGERREISETRVARSGDMRRQEWTENGERLALITRFDAGKSFLLNLNKQLYTETELVLQTSEKGRPKSAADPPKDSSKSIEADKAESEANRQVAALEFVEDHFAEPPVSLETRILADEYIANQLCKVTQNRATFADGRTDVTTSFRAESLFGLVMKTEKESLWSTHRVKIINEWRELRLAASSDEFVVPANFKKVQSLSRR